MDNKKTPTYHMNFHLIPFDEAAAHEWSDKAGLPWENTKRLMELRSEAESGNSYTDKIEKFVSG